MTEPLTVTELDQQTRDELQPPCEMWLCAPKPAEVQARFRCSCGSSVWQLLCDGCFGYLAAGRPAYCPDCGVTTIEYRLVAAEPLR